MTSSLVKSIIAFSRSERNFCVIQIISYSLSYMASLAAVGSLLGKPALSAVAGTAATKTFNKATNFVSKKMSTKPKSKTKTKKRKSGGRKKHISKRKKSNKPRRSQRRRRL